MNKKLLLLYVASDEHMKNLRQIAPDWDILQTTERSTATTMIEHAEVVMGNHYLCESLPYNKKKLKWIQTNSVGVDLIIKKAEDYLKDIVLTNAKGVYNAEICEHTIALILLLQRNLHFVRDAQIKHNWERPKSLSLLQDKNVLILGYGSLGKAIGEKLLQFGCHIFGVTTSSQHFKINNEQLHWKELLSNIDIVIGALPATTQTTDLFGEKELNKLPPTAFVINVGRAGTINEDALFSLLQSNKISGAALDVFEKEPLDNLDPIWNIKNLFISPHMARSKEIAPPFQFEKLFEENFQRYINQTPLLNIIDTTKGY